MRIPPPSIFKFIVVLSATCLNVTPNYITISQSSYAMTTLSTPNIPLNSEIVAKIRMGAGVAAVSYALYQLLDKGVTYVMDPKNNQVIIHDKTQNNKSRDYTFFEYTNFAKQYTFATPEEVCTKANMLKLLPDFRNQIERLGITYNPKEPRCYIGSIKENYFAVHIGPLTKPKPPKTLSFEQIAQKIVSNAKQGHPESIKFLNDISNEKRKENGGAVQPKPTTPTPPPIAQPKPKTESKPKEKEKDKEKEEDKKKKCLPVTEANIRMVLEPTTELAIQKSVSLAKLKSTVEWIEKGGFSAMKPIHVYENYIIVDGHHRFISMKLCHMEAPRTPWAIGSADKRDAYPIKNILLDK